ncbi:MAG: hypothetical protein LBU65_14440, partial [Planctomycetaceae bacterium]|nr:hypothetical protein [Planctomycetaceae bacterium]
MGDKRRTNRFWMIVGQLMQHSQRIAAGLS